jgi:4-hydroxy-tetrahydrodipicolinate synthase
MSIFSGCATALITPFTKNGVDYTALKNLLNFQIDEGIDAILVCGTTGEPSTMSAEEKQEVISFSIKEVAGRVPVFAGTGGNNTAEVIKSSIWAEKAGADALLVVTPYYNKCTQKGLIAHYNAVADAVNTPIIAYNVPSRTGVNLLPATFAEIAKHKNVVAMKEASGNIDQIMECIRLSEGLADVYSGDDAVVVPMMSMGGKGVISVLSNIMPRYMHNLATACANGNYKTAAEMQHKASVMIKAMFCEVNPIPVKKAAELMKLCNGIVRLPLTELEPEHTAELTKLMKAFGLI